MSLRRGACPTLAAPMLTGDGWLARLAPVEPLTPAQLGGLARAAARLGNGRVEVTARGSLQIRGLTPETAVALDAAVAALGIAVDAGVPVLTGALSGTDQGAAADPRPLAAAIRARTRGLAARLAPKVSVVVDGGGRLHLDAVKADLRLLAVAARWRVEVGGTAVALTDGIEAVEAAVALLERLAAAGPEARGRDLPVTAAAVEPRPERPPAVAVGPLPGAVGFGLPFGQTDAAVLAALATAAPDGCVFRPAPGRALVVTGGAALVEVARGLGLVVAPDDPRLGIVACSGAPACRSAEIATRALAAAIAARPELAGAPLHLSGCAKRCAQPAGPAVTFVGRAAAGDGLPAPAALRDFVAGWAE